MPVTNAQFDAVKSLLVLKITNKLSTYTPETNNMPFHVRLLGSDRMALFSFIHSINTLLGSSIFEQVSVILARPNFLVVERQYKGLPSECNRSIFTKINDMLNSIQSGLTEPNKINEIRMLTNIKQADEIVKTKPQLVDLYLKSHDGFEYYIDLKTAKPNIGSFAAHKRTLLDWVGLRQTLGKQDRLKTLIAIPYNPYEPKPYQRWTLRGILDIKEELKVADEYWDFVGGIGTYDALLDVFAQAGKELHPIIESRFSSFSDS